MLQIWEICFLILSLMVILVSGMLAMSLICWVCFLILSLIEILASGMLVMLKL
jgi:hypothetical protein